MFQAPDEAHKPKDENNTTDKRIIIQGTSPGSYLVRVWGIQNVWDNEHPYILSAEIDLNQFVILGDESVSIGNNSIIRSGDLGVSRAGNSQGSDAIGELIIGNGVELTGAGSRVLADRIFIKPNAHVYDIYFNELIDQGTVLGSKYSPLDLPLFTSYPAAPSVSESSKDISLNSGESTILHSDVYRTLITKEEAKVVLSGGLYSFEEWDLGPDNEIICNSPTIIVITGRIKTGPGLVLRPAEAFSTLQSQDIQVFVEGFNSKPDRDNGQLAVDFGPHAAIHAYLIARNGSVRIGPESRVVGGLIGRWITLGSNADVALDSVTN